MKTNSKQCEHCDKHLKGRLDKKFCNDHCRNAYHNYRNSDRNNYVRNVNNILRKNRRLLEELDTNGATNKVSVERMRQRGFNFDYYTRHYHAPGGEVYTFSYEYGYLQVDADWMLIVKQEAEQ